jgi:hypothetical protein
VQFASAVRESWGAAGSALVILRAGAALAVMQAGILRQVEQAELDQLERLVAVGVDFISPSA